MATCDKDSDCRSGYSCANLSDPSNPWAAVPIDRDRGNRACLVPISGDSLVSDEGQGGAFGDVCHSELPPEKPVPPAANGGSTAGVAGQTGAAGDAAGLGGAGG